MDKFFSTDKLDLYCGDCLAVLSQLPDKSVDLVFTSPPFNLGNNHHTGSKKNKAYADNLPEIVYQNWQISVLDELYRVVKDNGSLWYQHKNRIKNGVSTTPYQWLLKTQWLMKQEIVWRNGSQNFDKIRFYPMTERLYWLAKLPATKLFNLVNKHDDWHIEPVGVNAEHSRSFPEEIVQNVLSCFPSASVVLDPFVGSGTTASVALQMGRKAIGIDISEEYCALSAVRCLKAIGEQGA
jgi:modification methylase